ncbi:MAG: helix-turn-helix domain-containing protein [Bacteriovoracia bacterium]
MKVEVKSKGVGLEELPKDVLFDKLVWMTTEEAAAYLRKTVGALRTAVSRGEIRAHKWRRRLYFRRSELDSLLDLSLRRRGI